MVNKMVSQILSLTREPAPIASRQPHNVINHRKFYFTLSQDKIPNNFRPDLTPLYLSRTLNLKIKQIAALHKNLMSNYNKRLENKN